MFHQCYSKLGFFIPRNLFLSVEFLQVDETTWYLLKCRNLTLSSNFKKYGWKIQIFSIDPLLDGGTYLWFDKTVHSWILAKKLIKPCLHWLRLQNNAGDSDSHYVLALATLGDVTQIGLFLFLVLLPKVAKASTISCRCLWWFRLQTSLM